MLQVRLLVVRLASTHQVKGAHTDQQLEPDHRARRELERAPPIIHLVPARTRGSGPGAQGTDGRPRRLPRELRADLDGLVQLVGQLEIRRQLPIGAVLWVIHGSTAGRRWEASAARKQLHRAAGAAGVRQRFAPHQLRHAHAVETARDQTRSGRRCPRRPPDGTPTAGESQGRNRSA
jgi:integrase